jgi:glycosyltransferase involved in cell wall biosynthesis
MTAQKKRINNNLDLSLITPAYKAEKYIKNNLIKLREVLETLNVNYEIICVVDGKIDKTSTEAKKVSRKFKNIKVIGYKNNLGKGNAVRFGMSKARGKIIGFIDSDLDVDPNAIPMLLEHYKWYDADIIVGSKRHLASKVHYSTERRILSFGFQILGKVLFGFKIKDTQVGLKFFDRKVVEKVLPRLLVKRYAFDVELLAVSYHLGFKKIYEGPIELHRNLENLVHAATLKTILLMLWDTIAVFYRLKIIRYYDHKNNWANTVNINN